MEATVVNKYNTRQGRRVASSDIVLPVAKRGVADHVRLNLSCILDRDEEAKRVKVHYTGYGSSDDENGRTKVISQTSRKNMKSVILNPST